VINAEGEFQAAARLTDAADVISRNPIAIKLRYLQTLIEVSGSNSSTIVFPLPVDILEPLIAGAERAALRNGEQREQLDEAVQAAQAALEASNAGEAVSTRDA